MFVAVVAAVLSLPTTFFSKLREHDGKFFSVGVLTLQIFLKGLERVEKNKQTKKKTAEVTFRMPSLLTSSLNYASCCLDPAFVLHPSLCQLSTFSDQIFFFSIECPQACNQLCKLTRGIYTRHKQYKKISVADGKYTCV